MAELTIKIDVDNATANRKLAETDKHVEAVGTTAGNTSKSTGTLEKSLGGVGSVASEVGKGLLAAFTVKAVFDGISLLISSSVEYADSLQKLRSSTKISVEDLQKLGAIGRPVGASVEDMANAVNALTRSLDSKKGREALENMGLDFKRIRDLAPVQMFLEVGHAVQSIHDPVDLANAKSALFQKTFEKVAGAFEQNTDEIMKNSNDLSSAEVEATAAMGDAWDELTHTISIGAKRQVADFALRLSAWTMMADAIRGFPTDLPKIPTAPRNLKPITDAWMDDMEQIEKIGKKMEHDMEAANKKRAEELKKHQEEVGKNIVIEHKMRSDAVTAAAKLNDLAGTAEMARLEKQWKDEQTGLENNLKIQVEQEREAWKTRQQLLDQNGLRALAEIQKHWDEVEQYSKAALQMQADKARAIYDEMKMRSGEFSAATIKHFKDVADAAQHAAEGPKGLMGHLGELFTNTSKKMGEWQASLTSKFTEMFGGKDGGGLGKIIGGGMNLIFGPATGLITSLMAQGMKKMAELAWEGLKKIGGFFKDLFGGPSAKELAGREVVEQFSKNLDTMLTDAQRIEAGNEEWKKTVIVVRDAYLAIGKTEQEALDDVQRMWAAEKYGADAAKAAVDRINDVLRRIPRPEAPWADWPPPPDVPDYGGNGNEAHSGGLVAHTGGLVGTHGLARYHRGGLMPDERVIIGQTGEGVLNRRAMAHMGASELHARNRGATPGGVTVTVNATVQSVIESPSERRRLAIALGNEIQRQVNQRVRGSV